MAPKRGRRKVVTTTKVVEETFEVVSLVGSQDDPTQGQPEVIEQREEHSSVTKSIPIEGDDDQDTETQEEPDLLAPEEPNIYKIGTPPREEAPPRQEDEPKAKGQGQAQPNKESPKPKDGKKAGRKRGRRMVAERGEGYKRYMFKVLKQVHPGMGITSGAMTVINSFMNDMFERLASEASGLNMKSKKATMSAREIQGAVKLVLPGELGKHAIAEGSKAVQNYVSYRG